MKTALIFGVTGQDGYYLSNLLLNKGYRVIGVKRRSSIDNTGRLKNIEGHENLQIVEGDVADPFCVMNLITAAKPEECYNLAAQSHVYTSFQQPVYTTEVDYGGPLNILEAIRTCSTHTKFYQASTSEMFGKSVTTEYPKTLGICTVHGLSTDRYYGLTSPRKFQNEQTPMMPQSPYGIAKLAAHHAVRLYRQSYGLFACSGILFNHESELRGEQFVTRKITKYVAELDDMLSCDLKRSSIPRLHLGNIWAVRDWGHAEDYCIDYSIPLMTPSGWKFRDELNIGDKILTFNSELNKIEEDTINDIYDTTSNGDRYTFSGVGVDFQCTENHRIYYQKKSKNSKGGWSKWKVATAKEIFELFNNRSLRSKYDFRFPPSVGRSGTDYNITDDWIYLLGCLLAEGSINSELGNGVKVSLSQSFIVNEKIHSKIQDIINRLNLTAYINNKNNGVTEWVFSSESSCEILKMFDIPNIHVCPRFVYSFSERQAGILFTALMDCDGCWGNLTYSSKRYLLASDFQSICHLAGRRTSNISMNGDNYVVKIMSKSKSYPYVTDISKTSGNNKYVWCISTNNKTIITRSNNTIFVSGNCVGMHAMLQTQKADDYVLATGQTHTVKDFLIAAFKEIGQEWEPWVILNKKHERPSEVDYLCGDASKAQRELKWTPKVSFSQLVKRMVEHDIMQLRMHEKLP